MNTETLEFPVIAEVVETPRPVITIDTLRTTALAPLSAVEQGIAKLKAEHGSTDYDITTPHGYRLATTRRHAVRLVRYEVPKVVKAKRAELKDISEAVQTEGDRIIAALRAIEDPHDALITAEDERKAAEKKAREEAEAAAKAERDRIEAERVAKHRANIDVIRSYLTRAQGLPAERIESGIKMLSTVPVDGFEEFADEARAAHLETLTAMTALHRATLAREQEAARLEAQRIENERIAAEQKAEADRLAAERAELKRQADELARLQAEAMARQQREEAARLRAEQKDERKAQEFTEGQESQQVLKAEPKTADATDREPPAATGPDGGPMGAGQAAAAAPAGEVTARHIPRVSSKTRRQLEVIAIAKQFGKVTNDGCLFTVDELDALIQHIQKA